MRAGDINRFLDVEAGKRQTVRFVEGTAACGFPSPADDYLDRPLDFNELLIRNPAATFAVRLASDSMTGAGMFPGDIAVIDRSVTPTRAASCWRCWMGNSPLSAIGRATAGSCCRPKIPPFPISR